MALSRAGGIAWERKAEDVWCGVDAVGDIDGDGKPDVVAGAEDGQLVALSGGSGRVLWERRDAGRLRRADILPEGQELLLETRDAVRVVSARDGVDRTVIPHAGPAAGVSTPRRGDRHLFVNVAHRWELRRVAGPPGR